jgi:AcrR family transcriptional regulator
MNQRVRRRLSPEDRRNQLLDCARQIVVDHGLSTLTMERLATEAGVSNPLIYKYFDTRLQMLQALLIREYEAFRKSFVPTHSSDGDYRTALRGYVDVNFRQFASGDIVSILLSQADVRQAVKDQERSRYAPFFIKELASEFRLSTQLAERIVVLASGASIAAAEHHSRVGGDREAHIDQTVDFIMGGIEALRSKASD